MILIRIALIGLIVYLLVRSFMRFGESDAPSGQSSESEKQDKAPVKKVSSEIGEYVDYEEVDKKKT